MVNVEIYTKNWCPFCARAKANLNQLGIAYTEIDVTTNEDLEREMVQRTHRTSVPQIFVNNHHLGGSDDLQAVIDSAEFERLIDGSITAARAA